MGKRIIQQARGHGSLTYRVRSKAYKYRIGYPGEEGKASVIGLLNSTAHSAPLAKILINKKIFYNPAFRGMIEGQEIIIGGNENKEGNILKLKEIPVGIPVYNIEVNPGDGGKMIRTGGSSALVNKKIEGKTSLLLPSKQEKWLNENCLATIGVIAGHGRKEKPMMKAGKKHYAMKSRNKFWPRTSAVKMNVVDHPFGSGRGKNLSHGLKGKIPKRNAPPGAKVGSLWPRRMGRKKR